MHTNFLVVCGIALLMPFTSCTKHRNSSNAWSGPHLAEAGLNTYKPPHYPPQTENKPPEPEEPKGIVNLRKAISLALLQNPELASFSWEVRAQEARTLQAGLLPNPDLDVEVEDVGGSGEFRGVDLAQTTLQLSQLIELGGKRSKRKQLAALNRDLAGWDYEAKRADVLTEVTKTFVDVLAAQERLSLTEELVSVARQVLDTVSERVRAGKVSPIEETRTRVTFSTSQISLERARHQLEASRRQLAAIWGSTSPSFKKVEGELYQTASIPSMMQLEDTISQNPDLARWVVETAQRSANVDLEDARRIPDLTLSGGPRHLNESDDYAFVFGFSMPIPIFDRNQGARLEARRKLAKAKEQQQAVKLRVIRALAQTYEALASATVEVAALENEVLPGARTVFEAATEGYRLGKFGYLIMLDAQQTLFGAKVQYVEAVASYHKALAEVERLVGTRLDALPSISEQNQ